MLQINYRVFERSDDMRVIVKYVGSTRKIQRNRIFVRLYSYFRGPRSTFLQPLSQTNVRVDLYEHEKEKTKNKTARFLSILLGIVFNATAPKRALPSSKPVTKLQLHTYLPKGSKKKTLEKTQKLLLVVIAHNHLRSQIQGSGKDNYIVQI